MTDDILHDPLGRLVILHDHTWFGHILKGHPELAGHRDLVNGAIMAPTLIQFSRSAAECRVYYGRGPRPGLVTAVVADVVAGAVKTAYLARKPALGVREW